jgi:O-antigen/teichoic acid export membrane protein
MVASSGVGIFMAWEGYGVWALAVQALTATVVSTVLLWLFSSWRPAFIFSRDSARRLFGFSGWMFASGMLDTLYQKGYALLISKLYSTHDLGIYSRAENIQQLPSNVLMAVLSGVALPLYSSVNHDADRLRRAARISVRGVMLITSPVMFGLAVVAEPFIRLVFGERWVAAVPILQVLCIVGLLFPLQVINLDLLQAQGHAKLFFRLEVIKKAIGVVLLIAGSFYGLLGIACASAVRSVAALVINSHYTGKLLEYGMGAQLRDCSSSLLLGALTALVVIGTNRLFGFDGVGHLMVLIGVGGAFYLLINVLLGVAALKEAVCFFKREVRV